MYAHTHRQGCQVLICAGYKYTNRKIYVSFQVTFVKISHQRSSKQFIHQSKVLTKLFKNIEKIYGFPNGYENTTQNTFQNNACFTISGQFYNGGSKKTNAIPNSTKKPDAFKNESPNKYDD